MSLGFFMFGVYLVFFGQFLVLKYTSKVRIMSKQKKRKIDFFFLWWGSRGSISFIKKVGLKSAALFIYFEGLCTFDDMSLISSHTRLSRISAITSVSYPSSQSSALFWTLLLEPQTRHDSLLM